MIIHENKCSVWWTHSPSWNVEVIHLPPVSISSPCYLLIVFFPSILVLWDDKGTLAGSVPQMHDNNQFPKFLVLDKPGGKKSLIEIERKTGRKESVQKQTEEEYSDVKC